MNRCILLVVDVQTAMMKDKHYNESNFIYNLKRLISAARESGTEVIYVRHDEGKGGELEYGTEGWQIYSDIKPNAGEMIFDKRYNSSFFKTELNDYLDSKNIDTIILTGLQTEYCIDATCKSAFEKEYKVIVPKDSNSTYDNECFTGEQIFHYYNYKIWDKRFADVLPVDVVINDYMIAPQN